jgi:uncharacterized OB-fold protein
VYDRLQDFIEELRKGKFLVPICNSCKTKVWPPSHYCPRCLSKASLQIIATSGTLLEFTNSYVKGMEGTFGLIEMSGIKLIGSFDTSDLREGLKVRMVSCGVKEDGTTFYFFKPIKD